MSEIEATIAAHRSDYEALIREVEGAGLRRTVSEEFLKKAIGDAILEALPVFVHAAFAGGPEAT